MAPTPATCKKAPPPPTTLPPPNTIAGGWLWSGGLTITDDTAQQANTWHHEGGDQGSIGTYTGAQLTLTQRAQAAWEREYTLPETNWQPIDVVIYSIDDGRHFILDLGGDLRPLLIYESGAIILTQSTTNTKFYSAPRYNFAYGYVDTYWACRLY